MLTEASSNAPRWLLVFCLLAGLGDTVTGLLLLISPTFTLALMNIATIPTAGGLEETYLRFVGVFVGSVGLCYLYPLLGHSTKRLRRWKVVLEVTALLRFSVALFLIYSLLQGDLALGWFTVPLTDLSLAFVQLLILRKLAAHHDA